MRILLLLISLLLPAAQALAAPLQSHRAIHQAVTDFVRMQTQSLPGQVDIKVDHIDSRLRLRACPAVEAFIPPGGHLFGNSIVGVRCPQPNGSYSWSLYVPVHITVTTTLLVTNRPLSQGTIITANDFSSQSGTLTLPTIITDPAQIVGKVLRYSIGPGQVIRQDMLRAPYAIKRGQNVPIVVEGAGFNVHSEGKALNDAAAGDNVQVRTASGKVVSGTAQDSGEVLVRP